MDSVRLIGVALVALLLGFSRSDAQTGSLTGNTVVDLEGNGDTLWMVTTKGLNFTIVPPDSLTPLSWTGFPDVNYATGLAFGGGKAVIGLQQTKDRKLRLWSFDHSTGRTSTTDYPWNSNYLEGLADSLKGDFRPRDPRYHQGVFWMASGSGGLVRLSSLTSPVAVTFWPGVDKRAFPTPEFPSAQVPRYPDTSKAVLSIVPADSQSLFVATRARVWRFTSTDSTWDSLPTAISPKPTRIIAFHQLYSRSETGSHLYARIVVQQGAATTDSLYRFDPAAAEWKLSGPPKTPVALSFGPPDSLYLIVGDQVSLYRESTMEVIAKWDFYRERMDAADQQTAIPQALYDVIYLSRHNGSGSLWIGTENGLFLSRNEQASSITKTPFEWIRRSALVKRGLKETYAYPSIITPYEPRTTFAYNLEKPGNVTIVVYDWNMDHVKTIISKAPRGTGDASVKGISSQREDTWDGTDRNGRPVSPGVYYYRITSSTGGQGFGKIVVAR